MNRCLCNFTKNVTQFQGFGNSEDAIPRDFRLELQFPDALSYFRSNEPPGAVAAESVQPLNVEAAAFHDPISSRTV